MREDEEKGSTRKWVPFAAAAVAGLAADGLMYPADAFSTHKQAASAPRSLAALYRGFWAAAILSAPAHSAWLGTYDALTGTIHPSLAGFCAEVVGGMFFVPAEVLKRRATLGKRGYKLAEMPTTVTRLVRTQGLRSLYAGYMASVAAWTPFTMIYFASYERLCDSIDERMGRDLIAGGLGAAFAGIVTAPVDLVATRVQTRHNGATGVRQVVTDAMREKSGLLVTAFRAAPARVLWLAPHAAIHMSVFQELKQWMDRE